jgi:hypothetical protein
MRTRTGSPFGHGWRTSAVCRERGGHRVFRSPERDEEGISLRVDLLTAGLLERGAQELLVLAQRVRVAFAERLEQPGGALDIREQEGDCPGGQFGHRRSPDACSWPKVLLAPSRRYF